MTVSSTPNNNNQEQLNKTICCEGLLCAKNANEKIIVNVGVYGELSFYLCTSCAKKFEPKVD